jgi:hypothetical protein
VKHRASPKFWQFYNQLPPEVRKLADANYELLKSDPRHPSLHFKKIGRLWSVRVGIHYRAIAAEEGADIVWFWIGHHSEYDRLIGRTR